MNRVDYFNDPHAPQANSIVPAASAIVTNKDGKILLHRRSDNALWSLPGGVMEIGESIEQTIVREVKEETGCDGCVLGFAGAVAYETDKGPKIVRFWKCGHIE